jgi:hypothetical protein
MKPKSASETERPSKAAESEEDQDKTMADKISPSENGTVQALDCRRNPAWIHERLK